MEIFRAGMTVAMIFIGAILALLGLVVLVAAMKAGALTLAFGPTGPEVISYASEPARFLNFVLGLGAAPFVLGNLLVFFGMRRLKG